MNFEDYQESIMRTMPDTGRRDRLAMLALGTAGEAGEVADTVKKHLYQGHDLDPAEVAKEIGDVLWYLGNLCTAIGWDMGAVAEANVEKLLSRYPDGFEAGRSRERLTLYQKNGSITGGRSVPVDRLSDLDEEHNVHLGDVVYGYTDTL